MQSFINVKVPRIQTKPRSQIVRITLTLKMIDEEYIDKNFDPLTLTVAKLKSVLSEANVPLSGKQEKKQYYVDLFKQHVSGNQRLRMQTTPSNDGITNVHKNGRPVTPTPSSRKSSRKENPFQSPKLESPIVERPSSVKKFFNPPPIAGYVDHTQVKSLDHKRTSKSSGVFYNFTIFSLLAAILAISYKFYIFNLPICQHMDEFAMLHTNNYFAECIPCPLHSVCVNNEIICNEGYIKQSSLFFSPKCVPDISRLKNVETLVNDVSNLLSIHAGKAICGEVLGDQYLTEGKLKELIRPLHSEWSDTQFSSYWNLAMADLLTGETEVQVIENFKFLSKTPKLTLLCRVSSWIFESIEYYQYYLYGLLLLSCAICFSIFKYNRYMSQKAHITELVEKVIHVLILQDERFKRGLENQSALSMTQLRDFFLPKNASAEKTVIWDSVRTEVLHNSSIRETWIIIDGEQHEAWQWIGSAILNPVMMKQKSPLDSEIVGSGGDTMVENYSFTSKNRDSLYPKL
jgi:hypothetical protein